MEFLCPTGHLRQRRRNHALTVGFTIQAEKGESLMSILDRILRRRPAVGAKAVVSEERECVHGVLVPKWDDNANMGKEDLVTTYLCEACQTSFTKEKGLELRDGLAERIRLGGPNTGPRSGKVGWADARGL